jgi:ATP-binding cassette subfamily B protein
VRGRLAVSRHLWALSWRADRIGVLVVSVLVVAQAAALALTGIAQRWLVDGARLGTVAGIVAAATVGALARTVNAVGARVQTNIQLDLSERIDVALGDEILGAAARLETVEHLDRPEYLDRLAVLRNGTKTLGGLCWAVTETGMAVASVGFSVWLLGAVHPVLTLLALLAVPPLLCARRAATLLRRAQVATAGPLREEERLHELVLDPDTAKDVYASGAGPVLDARAQAAWHAARRTVGRARHRAAGWQLAGWAAYAAGYVGALALVAQQVSGGTATLGSLVLVVTVGAGLRLQVRRTVQSFDRVNEAGHLGDDYLWLRGYAAAVPGGSGGVPPPVRLVRGIELRDVSFTYAGSGRPVLDRVSLTLPAASTVAVVGENGAGKTTLVKLLTGMYEPTAGQLLVDGVPLRELDRRAWRRRVSGVFQDFARFAVTVREAVGVGDLPHAGDGVRVGAAVRAAGATGLVDRLDGGLDTQLGLLYGGTELSQGQWQVLALARGVMRTEPLLLVLDEPTAALDPQAEHELYERFAQRARPDKDRAGQITLLVSHRFSTVQMADHIVVLRDGTVAEQGTHDELMAAGGGYAELYGAQASGYR